jgi:hypothetical protein
METEDGYIFHSETTGIEGILVFFFCLPSFLLLLSDTCPARMMHLIRPFDLVMWRAEEGVLTTRSR